MPFVRGTIHELVGTSGRIGLAILTNDRWNSTMSQLGGAIVRPDILPVEAAYSVQVADGRFATAARVVSLRTVSDTDSTSPIGAAQTLLSADELLHLEDALARFLQLPLLLGAISRHRRPVGNISSYPNWGESYYANTPIAQQRKRFVVVSPNEWNAATPFASGIRTTSQFKRDALQFPLIQGGLIRACCGDLATFGKNELSLGPRSRPTPATATLADMVAIARGLVITHALEGALGRAGV